MRNIVLYLFAECLNIYLLTLYNKYLNKNTELIVEISAHMLIVLSILKWMANDLPQTLIKEKPDSEYDPEKTSRSRS